MKENHDVADSHQYPTVLVWLIRCVAVIIPLWGIGGASQIGALVPDRAELTRVENPHGRMEIRNSHTGPEGGECDAISCIRKRAVNGESLRKYYDTLWVPTDGSQTHLTLGDLSETGKELILLGPESDELTIYYFPCRAAVGQLLFGWRQGGSRGCDSFRVELPDSDGAQISLAPLLKPNIQYVSTRELLSQAMPSTLRYCSVKEESGRGWGFHFTVGETDNPCRQALQQCQATETDSSCAVASYGEEQINDPELVASMQCRNSRQGTLIFSSNPQYELTSELSMLPRMMQSLRATHCAMHVHRTDDLLISPANQDLTLMQAQPSGKGVAVDALVGDLTIVSRRHPSGFNLQEGFRYDSEGVSATPLDCPDELQSSPVRGFLNERNWSSNSRQRVTPEIANQIQQYRENFCVSELPEERAPSGPRIQIRIPFPRFPRNDNYD